MQNDSALVFQFRVGRHRVKFVVPPVLPGGQIEVMAYWSPVPSLAQQSALVSSLEYVRERKAILDKIGGMLGGRPRPYKVIHDRT